MSTNHTTNDDHPVEAGPLAGVRVLELGHGVAVRYCGRLLVRLGARVERTVPTDEPGHRGGDADRAFHTWLDQAKPVVAAPRGRYHLVLAGPDAATVARAEAVRRGLEGDPTLVEVCWFAPGGPYQDWPANDEVVLATSGLAYAFGEAHGPPTLAQGHAPQVLAGANACSVALAALLAPAGRHPRRVQVDVFESTMCLSETGAVAHFADPRSVSTRVGVDRFVPTYPCSSYRTADGWVGITCLTPAQWSALCEAVDRPDLAARPDLATAYRRLRRADEVDAVIAPAVEQRTSAAWVEVGLARRIPITAMPQPGELPRIDHWRRRGSFAPLDGFDAEAPTLPFRMRWDGRAEPRWDPDPAVGGPLSGLRVLDLTMGWAGPLATRTLADLGADVVKVESELHPDWWRGWEPPSAAVDPPTIEVQPQFNATNRNKRGIALDLRSDEGRATALALVEAADVVIDNFTLGVLERLGLGAEVQRARRPGVVSVSMPAFGRDGPLSGLRAYGSTVEQASGLPFVNGRPDWPPSLQHVAFGDPVVGVYATVAVLAALVGRPRLGGAEVDLAQVACLFEIGAEATIAAQLDGALPRRGNRRPRVAPCCVVPTAGEDRWLAVAVDSHRAWQGLVAVVGVDRWADDPTLATAAGRHARADEVEAAIATWAAPLDAATAAERLRRAGVPAAAVQPAHSLHADPHLVATGYWQHLDRRHVGRHLLGSSPFRLDGARPAPRRPAPLLGEHTAAILDDPRWIPAPRS